MGGEKLVKMLGFCQGCIFGQKFDFLNSVIIFILFSFIIHSYVLSVVIWH